MECLVMLVSLDRTRQTLQVNGSSSGILKKLEARQCLSSPE